MTAGQPQIQLFAPAAGDEVHWRLLSGNNRDLGRGARGFADAGAATVALTDLKAELHRLAGRTVRHDVVRWSWVVYLDDDPVATSCRPFDRLIRCDQAMHGFVAAFAGAAVRPDVVLTGARRFGSVA